MRNLKSLLWLLTLVVVLLGFGISGVGGFTTPAAAQGLAVCFNQPPGLGPQPCPTSAASPYIPLEAPVPYYADAPNGNVNTYSASLIEGVPAAAGTDVFCLSGSATKTIRILRWDIAGTQTTGGITPVSININSAADTGGTAGTTPTIIKHDTADAAVSATLIYYTANPTISAATGAIRTSKVLLAAPAGTSFVAPVIFSFGDQYYDAITLRGTAQQACLNWNGKTTSGNLLDSNITWTETVN